MRGRRPLIPSVRPRLVVGRAPASEAFIWVEIPEFNRTRVHLLLASFFSCPCSFSLPNQCASHSAALISGKCEMGNCIRIFAYFGQAA